MLAMLEDFHFSPNTYRSQNENLKLRIKNLYIILLYKIVRKYIYSL